MRLGQVGISSQRVRSLNNCVFQIRQGSSWAVSRTEFYDFKIITTITALTSYYFCSANAIPRSCAISPTAQFSSSIFTVLASVAIECQLIISNNTSIAFLAKPTVVMMEKSSTISFICTTPILANSDANYAEKILKQACV